MKVTPMEEDLFIPPLDHPYQLRTAYALGSRDSGLIFNHRAVPGAVWTCTVDGRDMLLLRNATGQEIELGIYRDVIRLSFLFDYMSFPHVVLEQGNVTTLLRFDNRGGDTIYAEEILKLEDVRFATLYRTEYADLGSVFNQPGLLYVDTSGNVLNRSYTTGFQIVDNDPILTGLSPTDEIKRVGMTVHGRLQIEVSKLK